MRSNVLVTFSLVLMVAVIYIVYTLCFFEKSPTNVARKYQHLNFPYVKESANTRPMQYFDDHYLYSINEKPMKNLEEEKGFLMGMVRKVAFKHNISPSHFSGGSFRIVERGIEFNLFFEKDEKRIVAFQPFTESFEMREVFVEGNQKVHIVVPLKGKLSSFAVFLDHLVSKILPVENAFTLTVVYFNDDSMPDARKLLRKKLSITPFFEWRFIPANDTHFSRGKGIKIGVDAAAKSPTSLVFVCDVDVLFTPEFLKRCRANTVYENQVYFPVVYSLFNPELVYRLHDKDVPPISDQLTVTTDNGFWRYFGFGMFCMHRNEYDIAGGVPETLTWGGEDVKFYQRFGDFPNIKIIRSLDTGIFHVFHPKNCTNVASSSYRSCLLSKASSEGTQVQLGLLLFQIQENIDLKKLIGKG